MNEIKDSKKKDCLPKTKTELALQYNSETTPKNAVRILRTWIQKYPGLVSDLEDANYNPCNHLMTPRQVRIVYKHLGDPP